MKNWDKILDDFARKCKGGSPDMTNPRHLALLRESLIKFGWNENATNEFLGNLREAPRRKKVKIMPAPPTKAGTPRFYYVDPTDNQIVALVEPTGTKRGWALATKDQVDRKDETPEYRKAIEGMTHHEKKRYDAWLKGQTSQQEIYGQFLTDEDKKLMEDFNKDLESYLGEKNPEKRKKLLQDMVDKYQLSWNERHSKLYVGAISFDARKLFSGQSGNSLSKMVVKDMEEMGIEVPETKSGANSPGQQATTASKIKMKTKHEHDDPTVTEVFDRDEFDHFDGRKGRKFRQLHGPTDNRKTIPDPLDPTKDIPNPNFGKLLKATQENSRAHLEHSMDPNENPTMDNLTKKLEELEESDNIPKGVRTAAEEHQQRMQDLMDGKVMGKDGKPIKIPSQEAAEYIEQSWGKMAIEMQEVSPEMASKVMKNLAEMAEYQRELAQGKEVYLPSSGTFPSGDKILIKRNGKGKVVNIESISIKYGRSGKYGAYGFPGEAGKYQEYHPNPNYRDRQSSNPARDPGYDLGVKDELVTDDVQYDKMIKESGLEDCFAKPDGKKCLQDNLKKMQTAVKNAKQKQFGNRTPKKEEMKLIAPELKALNKKLGKEMDKCFDRDKLNEKLGGGTEGNAHEFMKGPMEAVNILVFAGTLATSGGLDTIHHNHQTIEPNPNPPPEVIYVNHTDEGSPDPKLWDMSFRWGDDRSGGLITSYNSKREELTAQGAPK